MTFLRWLLPPTAIVAAWIALLWATRPRWKYCVDNEDSSLSYCDDGVFSLGATIGTVGLIGVLATYAVLVLVVRGPLRRRVLVIALAVLGVACVLAFGLNSANLEEVPLTIVD